MKNQTKPTKLQTNQGLRKRRRKGSALLESAFVFPTLLFTILFIMEAGRFLMVQQFIVERTRQVARAAAVNNWTAGQVKNYLVYGSATAPNSDGNDVPPGYMGLLPSQVSYTTAGAAGASDYRIKVTVQDVPAVVFIPLIAGNYKFAPVTASVPAQSMGATN